MFTMQAQQTAKTFFTSSSTTKSSAFKTVIMHYINYLVTYLMMLMTKWYTDVVTSASVIVTAVEHWPQQTETVWQHALEQGETEAGAVDEPGPVDEPGAADVAEAADVAVAEAGVKAVDA